MANQLLGIDIDTFELQPERSIQVDKNGMVTLSDTYRGKQDDVIRFSPGINARHPDYSFLTCNAISYEDDEGSMGALKLTYKGSDMDGELGGGVGAEDIVTTIISTTVSEESILSHKKLKDMPQDELKAMQQIINGNEQKEDGSNWADDIVTLPGPAFLERIRKGKITYLVPSVEVTISGTKDISRKGQVADVGEMKAPDGFDAVFADRNWLFMGLNETQEGDLFRYELKYKLSGPGQWDKLFYGDALE